VTTTAPSGRRVVATVLASQALRGVGYGLVAVQLGAVLAGRALDSRNVGWCWRRSWPAAAGQPWRLAAGRTGWSAPEAMACCMGPWLLPARLDRRPQATLTRGFGVYNTVATLAGAAGALLGALPAEQRLLGGTLVGVGVAGALLAVRLAGLGIETPRPRRGSAGGPLGSSRGIVRRLAGLFPIDSLAGGLVVQAHVAYCWGCATAHPLAWSEWCSPPWGCCRPARSWPRQRLPPG
jgi:hypothetical protein